MIFVLPGASLGVLIVDLHPDRVDVTCRCCGETSSFALPPNDAQHTVVHGDNCPMIELQEAFNALDGSRVRELAKVAKAAALARGN